MKLQHEVPPQHRDENLSTSKFLTPEEVAVFESYGPLKKGPYTKKEDDTLKKNWQTFCEVKCYLSVKNFELSFFYILIITYLLFSGA